MDKPTSDQKSPTYIEVKDVPVSIRSSTRLRWLNHIPWIAVTALTIATLCLFASATIVVSSNGVESEWDLQPHVVLGVLSSIATASLVVSLSTGVAITWWHAAHRGSEANSLHSIWSYSPMGGGAYSMIRHGFKNMNKVAVASTLTAIAGIVYSPLLQRASGVASASVSTNVTLSLNIAPTLPENYTGVIDSAFWGVVGVNNQFSGVVQRWYGNSNPPAIDKKGFACEGTCAGSVPSTGISYTCTNTTTAVPLLQQSVTDNFYGFSTNYTRALDTNQNPILTMTILFIDGVDENCNANLVTKNCDISAGTVDFPIKMTNTTILTNEKSIPISNFRPHPYDGDKPDAPEDAQIGPLGGLAWLGYTFFWTQDQIAYENTTNPDKSVGFSDFTNGTMAFQYYDYAYTNPSNTSCSYRWFDPSEDILNAFSEVLFWASIDAASQDDDSSTTTPTNFLVRETNERLVYTAVYSYLSVASIILLAAIVSVATTLWGWWHLEREVSMNPLETARAVGMFAERPRGVSEEREMLRLP